LGAGPQTHSDCIPSLYFVGCWLLGDCPVSPPFDAPPLLWPELREDSPPDLPVSLPDLVLTSPRRASLLPPERTVVPSRERFSVPSRERTLVSPRVVVVREWTLVRRDTPSRSSILTLPPGLTSISPALQPLLQPW